MRKNDTVYELGKIILVTEYFVCLIHNFFKCWKFAVITSLCIMSLIPLTANAAILNVTLKNAINDTVLPDQKIIVFEKLTDGSLMRTARSNTDINGKVAFDIVGIDTGRTFVLKASPYNAGSVYSDDLTSSGNYDFLWLYPGKHSGFLHGIHAGPPPWPPGHPTCRQKRPSRDRCQGGRKAGRRFHPGSSYRR